MTKTAALNIVSAAIGGIIVALFTYHFLGEKKKNSLVEKRYYSVAYGAEIRNEELETAELIIAALAKSLSEELNDEASNGAESSEKTGSEDWRELYQNLLSRINWDQVSNDSIWGPYGVVEKIEIENLNETAPQEVLIEGHETGVVIIESKSTGKKRHSGRFEVQVKVFPSEIVQIFHIDQGRIVYSWRDYDSEDILISVDGEYLKSKNVPSELDDLLSPYSREYPMLVFVLAVSGLLITPLVVLASLANFFPSVSRFLIRYTPNRDLANYVLFWNELESTDPERHEKIGRFVNRIEKEKE